jgi:hypothetical protein
MSEDTINHPPHYGGDTTYEAIKVIDAWGCNFCLGNAVKYIARAGRKPGADYRRDLRKAAWYIEHEIARTAGLGESVQEDEAVPTDQPVAAAGAGLPKDRQAFLVTDDLQPPRKPAKGKRGAKAAVKRAAAAVQAAERQKVCPFCRSYYAAKRKDQTNCLAPACRKAAYKSLTKKSAGVKAAGPAAAEEAAPAAGETCAVCAKAFKPQFPKQRTCSVDCAKELAARGGK